MAWGRLTWMVALAGATVLGGCGDSGGDDDGGAVDAASDSGSDAGMDSGSDAGMDSGTDAGPPRPFVDCDPFAEGACAEGEKCKVVAAFGETTDAGGRPLDALFFGCVPAMDEKGEGVPCTRFTSEETGREDFQANDCAQGLFCWETPDRDFDTCQPLCNGAMVDCGEGHFCQALNDDPAFGTCNEADDCDPVVQEGCEPGESCYILGATNGDLLGHCFEVSVPDGGTGAAGEPCSFINNCAPGTQCRADLLADGGLSDTASCHEICGAPLSDGGVADAGAADAGMDGGADAGVADGGAVSTGECPSGTVCEPAEPGEGAMVRTPTPPGFCQPEI